MVVVEGVVVGGNQLGRKLGFPTANIPLEDSFAVENGVYSSRVVVDGRSYSAMTNVGIRPSVDGTKRLLETHLFDFEGSLYGLTLRVELYEKVRDERRFASVEELREQIAKDSALVKSMCESREQI